MSSAGRAFEHVVRDTAIALGKEVAFTVEDSGTELDRSIVESLPQPLRFISSATRSDMAFSHPGSARPKANRAAANCGIIAKPKGGWAEIPCG